MKKKKMLLSTLMSVVFVFFAMLISGCGENPVDIEIVSGIPVVVASGDNSQPDWSNVKAKILFEDGTEKTVDYTKLIFGEVDTTTAGVKDVSVKYKSGEFQITIKLTVIDSKDINAEINAYSGTYDGLAHNAVTVLGLRDGDVVMYSTDDQQTWTSTMPTFKDAGDYKVFVKISREYRNDQVEEKTVSISKKQLEITAQNKQIVYGEHMPELTYAIAGLVNNETEDVFTTKPQITCTGTNVGTYTISVGGAVAQNYEFAYTSGTLTITKATYNMASVVWDYSNAFTYDGTEKTVILKNLPEGVSANYEDNSATNAGTYTARVIKFNYDETNFNEPVLPQTISSSCEWKINKAQNTISYSVQGFSGEYNGRPQGSDEIVVSGRTNETVEYSTDGKNVSDSTKTWQTQVPERREIGTTLIDVKISKQNYEPVYLQTYITITKISDMGITASGYEGNYTGDDRQVILHGILSGDTVLYSLDNKQTWQTKAPLFRNATDGIIVVNVKVSRDMYEDEFIDVKFDIKRVQLTIKVNDATVKYGEQAPEFTATYTGFVNNEKAEIKNSAGLTKLPEFNCNYSTGANAGETFDIIASGAESKNYTISYQKGTLTVEKAEVEKPTENTLTFTYNGNDQTYLPNGYDQNKMIISGNIQKNANPDAYKVTVTPNSNYVWADTKDSQEITFSFMIEQKVAELGWATTNLYYNGKSQVPVCEVTNLSSGDICEVVVDGGKINVGENYIATAKSLSNSNYKLPTKSITCNFNILIATNKWIVDPGVKVSTSDVKFTGEALFGNDTIIKKFKKVTDSDELYTDVVPTEDGEYNMMVIINATDNYTELKSVVKFYISNVEIESMASPLLTRNVENFVHKTNNLAAGVDNYYDLQLVGTSTTFNEINKFSADIEIYVKQNDNTYSKLTGADLNEFVSIDEFNHYLSFTNTAIGNTIKVVVSKDGVKNSLEYIIDIVSGYNVYTAQDLCVIENKGIHDWDKFKQGTIYENVQTDAVIIQRDIKVTDTDIPAEFFYSEEEANAVPSNLTNQQIAGTMKDGDGNGTGGNGRAIYHRDIIAGKTFEFYGNYFNIDYSELTKCVIESGHKAGVVINDEDTSKETPITAHVTFLKFDGVGKTSNINFKDVSFIGNAQRNARSANSGGAVLAKFNAVNSNISNSIYKNCFIGFMFDGGNLINTETTNVLKDSKGYDSYNTLLYVYGVNDLLIEGGEYVGAGGPVMIVDHVGNDESTGDGGYPSNVNVVGAKLESFVTGNEPWFVSYGATALVAQITALNAAYEPFNTTFLQEKDGISNLMNLKVVYKSASAEGITSSVVRGEVNYYKNSTEYEAGTGYGLDMTTYSKQASSAGSNILQNSYNGQCFNATMSGGQSATGQAYGMRNTESGAITNINMYLFNGMAIMLELYNK